MSGLIPEHKKRLPFHALQPCIFGFKAFSQDKRHCILEKVYFIYLILLFPNCNFTRVLPQPAKN